MASEDFFENLIQQFNNKLPFVAYRKPKTQIIKAILQEKDELIKIKDFTESGFVFAPFDDKAEAVLIPLNKSKTIEADVILKEREASHKFLKEVSSEEKHNHINLVQKGIKAIKSKQFQKVVLSRKETVSSIDAHPISIFKRMISSYSNAFVYVWFHPKVGLWLGATPETLLNLKGSRFSTMALAGTQEYKGNLDVIWDNKNIEEQQFVSDYILDNLKDIINDLKVSDTKTVKAGSLLHLRSDISGLLKNSTNSLQLLIKKLHPTPAVCGLPKKEAKQFIIENENYKRDFYTGFLGELNLKEVKERSSNKKNIENKAYTTINIVSDLFVNLRCMQFKNNDVILYVGGGITKESVPEIEWEETLNKAKIIKRVL
jgi:isochorismate synthase